MFFKQSAALAQMVACLPPIQRVRGSLPDEVEIFITKSLNYEAGRVVAGQVLTYKSEVTSSVYPRASISYPQARSCNRG